MSITAKAAEIISALTSETDTKAKEEVLQQEIREQTRANLHRRSRYLQAMKTPPSQVFAASTNAEPYSYVPGYPEYRYTLEMPFSGEGVRVVVLKKEKETRRRNVSAQGFSQIGHGRISQTELAHFKGTSTHLVENMARKIIARHEGLNDFASVSVAARNILEELDGDR